tara:strand:- start:822 stop:1166 length:345 start_codon:yes stop_codon:yes gene_type:complete
MDIEQTPEGLSPKLIPLYGEAMKIVEASPASACALLRMLLQMLIQERGLRGRDLHKDINTLVDRGAPVGLLRALDAIELAGSESRQPGQINLVNGHKDAQNMVMFLHLFVNQMP